MQKEVEDDFWVLGLNKWKDRQSCQLSGTAMERTVREEDGEDDEDFRLGHTERGWRGQRPLSSHNKGVCWSTVWNLIELQGKEPRSGLLSWNREACGSWEQAIQFFPSPGCHIYFCPSLTGQCMLPASPFPPLPVCFLLSLIISQCCHGRVVYFLSKRSKTW